MRTKPTKLTGRIEPKHAMSHLQRLAWTYKRAWESACLHDGIESSEKLAVFTDGNPFAQFVGICKAQFDEAYAAYQAGGYVGLEMGG